MRDHGSVPYQSVDEMVDESAALLQGERDDDPRHVRSWVLPSEIAFHTGLDEQVVVEAMIRLGEGDAKVPSPAPTEPERT